MNSKYYTHNQLVRFAVSAKFHKNWSTFQFWDQISQVSNFQPRSSIPINVFIVGMFDLFWLPNFRKIRHIAILRPNLPKLLTSGQDPQFQASYLWLRNLPAPSAKFHSIGNIFHFWDQIFLEWGDWYLF